MFLKKERVGMINKLNSLVTLAEKEKDISNKMSNGYSLFIFIEKLNCKPDIFEKVIPLDFIQRQSLIE